MNLPQALWDLLTHAWAGLAQFVNIALALVTSGAFFAFLTQIAAVTNEPLTWASAIALFMVLLEWIPTLLDVIQANVFGQSTKVASGDSLGEAMRMPWSKGR